MAKLTGAVPFPKANYEDYKTSDKAQTAAYKALEDRSNSLPDGELVGALVQFQIADGYAVYVVSSVGANTVELKHVPYGDGYQIPAAHMRGLTKKDIAQQVESDRRFNKIFKKHA
jgi:hypothetical protein